MLLVSKWFSKINRHSLVRHSETSSLNPINIQELNRLVWMTLYESKGIFLRMMNFAFDPIHKNERAFFKEGFKVMMGLVGVMHRHSLVDFFAFQWPFFSLYTSKWPGMLVHNYTSEM